MLKTKDLLTLIDQARAEVEAWHECRHTRDGRRRLARARKTHKTMSIAMGGGQSPYYLTPQKSSVKLSHNAHITSWEQLVMYLSAHRLSGIVNTCTNSTPQCREGCLEDSGHLAMEHAKIAMRCRTRLLVEHTADALIIIAAETETHATRIHACGKSAAERLNGTSDIAWPAWYRALLRASGIDQHFDYTKDLSRPSTPDYYLAPSATERTTAAQMRAGMVVVVDIKRGHPIPTTYAGLPTIDGDHENGDLRFLDPIRRPGAIVLLRAKGPLVGTLGSRTGFVKPATMPAPIVLSAAA